MQKCNNHMNPKCEKEQIHQKFFSNQYRVEEGGETNVLARVQARTRAGTRSGRSASGRRTMT